MALFLFWMKLFWFEQIWGLCVVYVLNKQVITFRWVLGEEEGTQNETTIFFVLYGGSCHELVLTCWFPSIPGQCINPTVCRESRGVKRTPIGQTASAGNDNKYWESVESVIAYVEYEKRAPACFSQCERV